MKVLWSSAYLRHTLWLCPINSTIGVLFRLKLFKPWMRKTYRDGFSRILEITRTMCFVREVALIELVIFSALELALQVEVLLQLKILLWTLWQSTKNFVEILLLWLPQDRNKTDPLLVLTWTRFCFNNKFLAVKASDYFSKWIPVSCSRVWQQLGKNGYGK